MKRVLGRLGSLFIGMLVVGLLLPAQAPAQPRRPDAGSSYSGPVPLPENGVLFGAFIRPDDHTGADRREALMNFEALLGRPMAIERVYKLWDDPFPDADDLWSRDLGHTLYVSWNASPRSGQGCKQWADIAAGLYDAEIDAKADALKAYAAPIIFSFHHEPTTKPEFGGSCGTGDDYKDAWRRIRLRLDAAGVDNATYAWTMTALSFQHARGDEFYPGNGIIDVISADGYNWYGCEFHQGPWREVREIFEDFYDYGVGKGKPMMFAEWGSGEDDADPNRKAEWFSNAADQLKQWPEVVGTLYFNVGTGGACDRYVDSSQASLDAYTAIGADPWFNPPVITTEVSISDSGFTPGDVTIPLGTLVRWTNNGPGQHSVVAKKMGLFNSGTLDVGSTFRWVFTQAGTYSYRDALNGALQGAIKVAPLADPPSGNETTTFTITWAANLAPTGYSYDVQIKRPGGTWTNWVMDVNGMATTLVPDGGVGSYSFRARYRKSADDSASGWSPAVRITVS